MFSRSCREVVLSWMLRGLCGSSATEVRGVLAKAADLSGPQVLLQYHWVKYPLLKVLIFYEDQMLFIF